MSNFQDIFMDASNAANSHVCVGLDPDPELMPVSDIYEFCVSVIDATADSAAAFKPNLAFFEVLGVQGFASMKRVVEYILASLPPVCLLLAILTRIGTPRGEDLRALPP